MKKLSIFVVVLLSLLTVGCKEKITTKKITTTTKQTTTQVATTTTVTSIPTTTVFEITTTIEPTTTQSVEKITIRFYMGKDDYEDVEVVLNEIYTPTDPTKYGYEFLGWYLEDDTLFDFSNTPITEPINVYAKWELLFGPIL